MFFQVAHFEFHYLVKQPVFRGTLLVLLALAFAGVALPSFEIGAGGNVHKNAPSAIVQITLNLAIIFLFAVAAFVAGTVVRDDDTGFAGILRTTSITKFDYLFGRFTGSFLAIMLAFMAVPIGICLGTLSPWLDRDALGPFRLDDYIYTYLFLALPTIFFAASFLFAIATAKRSMTWAYIGLIGLLVVTVIGPLLVDDTQYRNIVSLTDPFGLQAYGTIVRYWSADELNTKVVPVEGFLLLNRLLFVCLGCGLLGLAFALFKMETSGQKVPKATQKTALCDHPAVTIAPSSGFLPDPRQGAATSWAQLKISTKFELSQVFKSPAFFVILLMGLAVAFTGLFFIEEGYGGRYHPVTRKMIEVTRQVFSLFPIIVAIYYAGELVWRERAYRMNLIVDATAAPNWVYVLPKIIAISLALFSILIASVAMGIVVQISQGVTDFELSKYLLWYIVPLGVDMVLLAVLAVLCQVLVSNKFVGWGLMVVYLLAIKFLPQLGFGDFLYLYGKTPDVLYSDMSGTQKAGSAADWFRMYWSAFATLLVIATIAVWPRGLQTQLALRLQLIPSKLTSATKFIGAIAVVTFVGVGMFIYTNTHVWNAFRSAGELNVYLANYEKALLAYESLPIPTVKDVKIVADIYPAQTKLIIKGNYILKNEKNVPITQIHLKWDRDVKVVRATIDGGALDNKHAHFNYQIFNFPKPLAPGSSVTLNYVSEMYQRGFKNDENTAQLLTNGTFVSNLEFGPIIGVKRFDLLTGKAERKAQGLSETLAVPALDDPDAKFMNYNSFDFVNSDITLSTSADQTAIAPGAVASDTIANGRRTIRYVSKAPMDNFFSLQSGRYDVKSKMYRGFPLQVFYHPQHGFNVDRMLNAMHASLTYYEENFGPYQFDFARIVEFPAYRFFAQSFAGTMPYAEGLGFLADLTDPKQNDVVTVVVAHELAHQYWGGQLNAANAEGAEVLVETLAQYSALMVHEKIYGRERSARLNAYTFNSYLEGRSNDRIEEVPLLRSFGRSYLHYDKGLLAMNLLRNRMGEAQVNVALQNLLKQFPSNKGAPYPTTRNLVGHLRDQAPINTHNLISDLFDRITLYDLRVVDTNTSTRADGRYDVTMTIEAHKYYANGVGKETEAPLNERFTIGAFLSSPAAQGFNRDSVITYEARTIKTGRQVVRFISNVRPKFVGVDPLVEFVDKRPDDNVRAVGNTH